MSDLGEDDIEKARPPDAGAELIIGLVGAVGAGLDDVVRHLENALEGLGYRALSDRFHLSDQIKEMPELLNEAELVEEPEDQRIRSLQRGGNEIRETLGRNDALALLTCLEIRDFRKREMGSRKKQVPRQAYILTSLKTPAEVETLRRIYGDGFILVAVYAPTPVRQKRLSKRILDVEHYEIGEDSEIDERASEIIDIDRHERGVTYGQNVRDTFPKADLFLDATESRTLGEQVDRSVNLLFGDPFETPGRDEQCMYIADAARLRSAALGRQVGATLARPEGEVLSIGCNDAPRAGGGLYWPDQNNDNRDFQLGKNISQEKRLDTLKELLDKIDSMDALRFEQLGLDVERVDDIDREGMNTLMEKLDDTRLSSLIEFYRATHAEMEAILSASRKGIPIEGTTLYSTTFPCHECTRHIIAAGIDRVVYVEPYPKSLGPNLHGDAVTVDGKSPTREIWKRDAAISARKVAFEPFVGIGPRIYDKVFQAGKRKDENGQIIDWPPENPEPVFGITHSGWWADETLELKEFNSRLEEASDI